MNDVSCSFILLKKNISKIRPFLSQDGGDNNPFLPFVQGMMQSLLSAEVLLPSLKELLEKYPVWLAENGDKIDPADRER